MASAAQVSEKDIRGIIIGDDEAEIAPIYHRLCSLNCGCSDNNGGLLADVGLNDSGDCAFNLVPPRTSFVSVAISLL